MCVITVALALVWKDGRLLISRRRADQHLAGLWEFPGGKCQPGESPEACAVREALEETGNLCRVVSTRAPIRHSYSDRTVCLVPVECVHLEGEPRPVQVQESRWASPEELPALPFPEANRSLIEELCREAAASGREPASASGTSGG